MWQREHARPTCPLCRQPIVGDPLPSASLQEATDEVIESMTVEELDARMELITERVLHQLQTMELELLTRDQLQYVRLLIMELQNNMQNMGLLEEAHEEETDGTDG